MSNLGRRVAKSVGRHFVTLSCVQQPPGNAPERSLIFSGFLMEAKGLWFYVTAGHVLRGIESASGLGYTFDVWRLDDQTAGNAFAGVAVPYHFDLDQWLVVRDEHAGIDYAATPIDGLYRMQLEAGGVMPLGRSNWGSHLDLHEHWVLYGIPSETVQYDGETIITGRAVVMPLREAPTPASAAAKADNQFYAELTDIGDVKDIDGMSGGPVFALRKVDGNWGYSLIGVQSAWYPPSLVIAACPIASFGALLEEVVEAATQSAPIAHGAAT